jgi:hypothetical protein
MLNPHHSAGRHRWRGRKRPVRCGFTVETSVEVTVHRAAQGRPYAAALLNLWAGFTGGTQGHALLTAPVPVDAPVPKSSTGGSYGHSRLHACSCMQ